MSHDTEIGYKARQLLNEGLNGLDADVAVRLHRARQAALDRQRVPVAGLRLAGLGRGLDMQFGAHARTFAALLALTLGIVGTNYWNTLTQIQQHEEIDSALLVDDLPPSAYLDEGFDEWLETEADSGSDSGSQ